MQGLGTKKLRKYYDNRETPKMSSLLSGKINKY